MRGGGSVGECGKTIGMCGRVERVWESDVRVLGEWKSVEVCERE